MMKTWSVTNGSSAEQLETTTRSLRERMRSLENDIEWRKQFLIRSIYEQQDEREQLLDVMSNLSVDDSARRLASDRLRAIGEMSSLVASVRSQDEQMGLRVEAANTELVSQDEDLMNSDLRSMVTRIKNLDEALKQNTTTTTETMNSVLSEAMETANSMNDTVQTALLSIKTQLDASNQNTQFTTNVASLQASKLIDFASKLETQGKAAQATLTDFWQSAASKAKDDARSVQAEIQSAQGSNDLRLSRVFQELSDSEAQGAQVLDVQGRDLEVQLAILRRLVGGLVGVWSQFADSAEQKHLFFEAKNREFLQALDNKVQTEKDRLNAEIKSGIYQVSTALGAVDQAWTSEAGFELEMTRGQEDLRKFAEELKIQGTQKAKNLENDAKNFQQVEISENKNFNDAVENAIKAFEARIDKKVQQVLDL